jgi:P-loop Domain of unknown function (DUF2791)
MSISMQAEDWLSMIRKEYLQDFILSGGATVKFVVPLEGLEHQGLLEKLRQAAEENGYLFVAVDAATTKAHMIDGLFHAAAKQVAWDDLAYAFLCAILSDSQYRLPDDRKDFNLAHLAVLNGLDLGEMRRIINSKLRDGLFRDYAMAQEFRIAMLRLCQTQLDPQEVGTGMAEAIKEWLRGELRLISALKPVLIFQKIGRHNGRYMLFSLSHWLHVTGKAGLVMTLDISRFLEARRPKEADGSIYYSTPAVMDGYEVLRQFIDGTDELEFCLTVVVTPPNFLTPDERRGLWAYEALKLRIWDDVRDRLRPNPLSSLIRISAQQAPANLRVPGGFP